MADPISQDMTQDKIHQLFVKRPKSHQGRSAGSILSPSRGLSGVTLSPDSDEQENMTEADISKARGLSEADISKARGLTTIKQSQDAPQNSSVNIGDLASAVLQLKSEMELMRKNQSSAVSPARVATSLPDALSSSAHDDSDVDDIGILFKKVVESKSEPDDSEYLAALSELAEFFTDPSEQGEAVLESLAKVINKCFRAKVSEHNLKNLGEKFNFPSNAGNMHPPKQIAMFSRA